MSKVLIVDDNADERLIFAALLEHHGFTVITASDGRSALHAANEHSPELILMDVHLPGMNGLAATEMLKRTPGTSNIPVICVTAFDITIAEARSAGCLRLLRKPVSPGDLIHTVSATLRSPGPETAA